MAALSRSIEDDIMCLPAYGRYYETMMMKKRKKKKNILRDIPHRGLDSVPNYSDKPMQHSLLLTFSLFRRAFTGEFFYWGNNVEEEDHYGMVFSESTTSANILFFLGYSSGKPPRKDFPNERWFACLSASLSTMIIRNYQVLEIIHRWMNCCSWWSWWCNHFQKIM